MSETEHKSDECGPHRVDNGKTASRRHTRELKHWHEVIRAMRKQQYGYRRVTKELQQEGCGVTYESIRQYIHRWEKAGGGTMPVRRVAKQRGLLWLRVMVGEDADPLCKGVAAISGAPTAPVIAGVSMEVVAEPTAIVPASETPRARTIDRERAWLERKVWEICPRMAGEAYSIWQGGGRGLPWWEKTWDNRGLLDLLAMDAWYFGAGLARMERKDFGDLIDHFGAEGSAALGESCDPEGAQARWTRRVGTGELTMDEVPKFVEASDPRWINQGKNEIFRYHIFTDADPYRGIKPPDVLEMTGFRGRDSHGRAIYGVQENDLRELEMCDEAKLLARRTFHFTCRSGWATEEWEHFRRMPLSWRRELETRGVSVRLQDAAPDRLTWVHLNNRMVQETADEYWHRLLAPKVSRAWVEEQQERLRGLKARDEPHAERELATMLTGAMAAWWYWSQSGAA